MNEQDLNRFAMIMNGVAENFTAPLSTMGIDMKFRALAEYDIEQIEGAALEIIRTRKYTKMPTVAEFIEAIDGSAADHALLVAYGGGDADDPIADEVRRALGGERVFGLMQESELPRYRERFAKMYAAKSREAKRRTRVVMLDNKKCARLDSP